jgi:SAM-dependent methyltransferase
MMKSLQKFVTFGKWERDHWIEMEASRVPNGARILDVGAGPGPYRHLFAHCEFKTHDFAMLDPDPVANDQVYGQLDYVSDITAIPVSDASFDVIICTEVLEHVPEPVRALAEMARILKPGGILLLTAPQRSGEHQAPYHFYGGFTTFFYQRFLPELGLEIQAITPNGGFFKHYGEAGWQFVNHLFPVTRPTRRRMFYPVVRCLQFIALLQSVICHYLDVLDEHKGMTVGFHVKARKPISESN